MTAVTHVRLKLRGQELKASVYDDRSVYLEMTADRGYGSTRLEALKEFAREILAIEDPVPPKPLTGVDAFNALNIGDEFRWEYYYGPLFTKVSETEYWVPREKRLNHRDNITRINPPAITRMPYGKV